MAGITETEVALEFVENAILAAESVVDRLTNSTYWSIEDSGSVASATDDTITITSAGWTEDVWINEYVWIYSGTGIGQARLITDNTQTVLTVENDWETNPDATSKFKIFHTGTNAHVEEELRDCDNTDTLFTDNYPLRILQTVEVDSVSVTPSKVYVYKDTGKLVLSTDAEASKWVSKKAQLNKLNYWFGVYPMIELVKRMTGIYASMFILQTQMGGTHNIPSTYSLPEGSCSIGQAYINIKGTWDTLMRNKDYLEKIIPKYASFFA